MTKPRLVITRKVFDSTLNELSPFFEIDANQADTLFTVEELAQKAAGADALLVVASDPMRADFLNQLPKLKMLATGSVGTNHIDLNYCHAHQINVSNTPDVLTEATADMAWALLAATARRVTEAEQFLRAGQWDRWAFDQFLGAPIHGATLGIAGMGRIGSAVARRGSGFSMPVIYHNRSALPSEQAAGATWVSKDELLARSDFLVLLTPYSPNTHHWIGQSELAKMKSSAILINIARGGIVDDSALASALESGVIAGAGLDVFEGEPQVNPHLLALKNLVLTPHIGSSTRPTREAMAMLAAKNLVAWAQGHVLLTPV